MRKKDDGTYSPFQSDEDEASFLIWEKENKLRIEMAEKSSHESLAFMWCMTEWQYERVNTAWNDTLELLGTFKEIIAMKESAIKNARLSVVLENIDAINEHNSRILGGKITGIKGKARKASKHSAIQDKVKELATLKKPKPSHKAVARELGFSAKYVERARKEKEKGDNS